MRAGGTRMATLSYPGSAMMSTREPAVATSSWSGRAATPFSVPLLRGPKAEKTSRSSCSAVRTRIRRLVEW